MGLAHVPQNGFASLIAGQANGQHLSRLLKIRTKVVQIGLSKYVRFPER